MKLSPDGKLRVFNFNGSVDVILDVVGYYTNSSLRELASDLGTAQSDIGALEALNAGPRLSALEGVFGENTQQANPGRGGDCYLGEIILTAGCVAHG